MKGFTLVETIVAIAIFTLILGAVSSFIIFGFRTQNYAFEQGQAIQETRTAIDQMTKEIREATAGGDGSYLLERVDDYELVFYGDIDKDGQVERVRYFINPAGGPLGQLTDICTSTSAGGSCSITFNNYLMGGTGLDSAEVQVSARGDVNSNQETVEVSADGTPFPNLLCTGSDCSTCAGSYEDPTAFDVTAQAADDVLQIVVDGSNDVGNNCNDWPNPDYSLKAQVVFSWQENALVQNQTIFYKGITQPVGFPVTYPTNQEQITVLSEHIINEAASRPLFTYYDENDQQIVAASTRLSDTTRIRFELIVNVNPNRAPDNFTLESSAQLRNLKTNL